MRTKLIIFILIILTVVGVAAFLVPIRNIFLSGLVATRTDKNSFEEKREQILSELHLAIEEAEEIGKYKCCIEPLCTMCYLGDWIWKDGTCDCDGLIARGEWDRVCPQCQRGIEEGRCKSEIGTCSVQ